MTACIQKFEELLLQKANKGSVYDLQQKVVVEFVSKFEFKNMSEELMEMDNQRHLRAEALRVDMLDITENLQQRIKDSSKEIADEKFKEYDRITKTFSRFFNSDELDRLIDQKADIEMITQLKELLVEKTQLA